MEWIAPAVVLIGVVAILAIVALIDKRLERTERKLNALLRHFNLEWTRSSPLSDRIKELARDPKRKIEAIKVYREETGAGLAEAKEAVEAFMDSL
jgi:ribosomal protein L7/L12